MIKHLRQLLLTLAAICILAPAASAARLIVELAPGADIVTIAARYGLTVISRVSARDAVVYLVSAPDPLTSALLNAIDADPAVKDVDTASEVHAPATPPVPATDPTTLLASLLDKSTIPYFGATVRTLYAQQPAAALIHLPDVLSLLATGDGTVAVIDTGADPNHPALKNVLVGGYDFTRNQAGPASELADLDQSTVAILDQSTVAILDKSTAPMVLNQSTVAILDQSTVAILDGAKIPSAFGHGTMVAGLIHLVAPTARIMPLKAFRADGTADIADIVRAVYYAVDNGAKVINMSFSSVTPSPALSAAMRYAYAHNVICVASAGNYGRQQLVYPAADYGVLGIASTDARDRRSVFSDYGQVVELAAPGEGLITTYPGGNYAAVWGTSFSAALVSGAAALVVDVVPQVSPASAENILEHGKQLDSSSIDSRLDVLISLQGYLNNKH